MVLHPPAICGELALLVGFLLRNHLAVNLTGVGRPLGANGATSALATIAGKPILNANQIMPIPARAASGLARSLSSARLKGVGGGAVLRRRGTLSAYQRELLPQGAPHHRRCCQTEQHREL